MDEFKKTRLENGLRVLTKKINSDRSLINFFVKAGSKYEKSSNNGVSHLIEHLFLNSLILPKTDKTGTTSKEITVYKFTQENKNTLNNLQKICNAFYFPKFANKNYYKKCVTQEIPIIEHEIKMLKNNKNEQMIEDEHGLFKNSLNLPILGRIEILKNLKFENFMDFYRKRYIPKDAVVLIESQFSHENIIKHIKQQKNSNKICKIVGGFKNSDFLIFFIIKELLDKKNIRNFYLPYKDTGLFVIYNKPKDINIVVDKHDFNAAKDKIASDFLFRRNSPGFNEDISYGILHHIDEICFANIEKKLKQISYETICKTFKNLIHN
ncbi:hypothetical protein COBT_001700 [Conglomerata obtusa]